MKRYTQFSIVGVNPGEGMDTFQNRLAKKVEELQVGDHSVEIQFQTNGAQCIALVLQYLEY